MIYRPRLFRPLVLLATACFGLLDASSASAQPRPSPELPQQLADSAAPDSGELAVVLEEGRRRLLRTIRPKSAASLGFDEVPRDADLTIAAGLDESLIQVQKIREFRGGSAQALLVPQNRKMFPLVVGGKVRAAMTVAQVRGKWAVVSTGSASLIRALMVALAQAGPALSALPEPKSYGIVRVNGLNQYFISARSMGKLLLIPIHESKSLNLSRGVPVEASLLLLRLRPAALRYRGGAPT